MPIPKAPKKGPTAYTQSSFALSATVLKSGNINLRFEGIGETDQAKIKGYLDQIVSHLLGDLGDDEDLMNRWFGTSASVAKVRLGILAKYLSERCETMTFVKKVQGACCDNARVNSSDYGQVLPIVMTAGVSSQTLRTPGGEVNVPRGLRVFISPQWFSTVTKTGEIDEQLNTIIHEITHKVLDTTDHKYGPSSCMKLAKNSPVKAAENADNYGYLLAESVLKWA